MFGRVCLLAAAALTCCPAAETPCQPQAPCYSAEGIINIASGETGALAPDTLASLYGTLLSYVQKAVSVDDIRSGELPVLLPGAGVRVYVGGWPAQLYLVSPGQINFLVPSNLKAAEVTLQVVRDGTAGPALRLRLRAAAPALFQLDFQSVLASKFDYSLITEDNPAHPGEWVILWGTGFGAVTPPAAYGMLPTQPASVQQLDDFRVLLNGAPVAPDRIAYAGVAVGYAGLFHVNLWLPADVPNNPEVRIAAGDQISPPGLHLSVKPPPQ